MASIKHPKKQLWRALNLACSFYKTCCT